MRIDVDADLAARALAVDIAGVMRVELLAMAEEVKDWWGRYPRPRRAPQPFRSAKQRRGFFAALRSGRIDVPYQRGGRNSQRLGTRWQSSWHGLTATLENTASYAGLVHGRKQAQYHAGYWRSLPEARKYADTLVNATGERIAERIRKGGR